jgi:uncharacterized protein (DUF488 family)
VEIYTIGYTKKSAAEFFDLLRIRGIKRMLDIRLNNTSQLAGFSKRDDLAYFLREICDCDYEHEPRLAPTDELLEDYKGKQVDFDEYTRRFKAILVERAPEQWLDRAAFARPTALLCAEPTAERCHRRLVAEYLQEHWGDLTIIHL